MTTKIKWRLSALPEPLEVAQLVQEGILTKEEAREILFSQETDHTCRIKGCRTVLSAGSPEVCPEHQESITALQEEIKFLRELVQKLSNNQQSKIIETIRYVEKPYTRYEWYQPYVAYCGVSGGISGTATAALQAQNSLASTSGAATQSVIYSYSNPQSDFTSIKTF